MEVNVKILQLLPEQRGTNARGEWVRNSFVGETEGEYPKKMMFEVMGVERWEKMRPYVVVGNVVKVSFDISSREWNERWFTSLTAFSVYGGGNTAAPQSEAPVESKPAPVETAPSKTDDLPF